jgi:adenine-specific DNA methylase
MDPPYYNNVQYAELSDYFYVWDKRALHDLYPDLFTRRLTNKQDEAVANPARDGTDEKADARYEELMAEIFAECRRVLKDDGRMMLMFTHKSQQAWEALTTAVIRAGWTITASLPVESETEEGIHTKETASAISSVFITCRKRSVQADGQATWVGFGGTGVQQRIRTQVQHALKEFERLRQRLPACTILRLFPDELPFAVARS